MNIFLVDDDEIFQMIAKVKIEHVCSNANIVSLLSGENALQYINTCSEKELPTIMFLDVNMSGMNGWEFIAELNRGKAAFFPICMISSSIDPKDKNKAKQEARVINFLEKPFNLDKFKILINSLEL